MGVIQIFVLHVVHDRMHTISAPFVRVLVCASITVIQIDVATICAVEGAKLFKYPIEFDIKVVCIDRH